MSFDNVAYLKGKTIKELSELLEWYGARQEPRRFVVVDQIVVIKMIRAEKIGRKKLAIKSH